MKKVFFFLFAVLCVLGTFKVAFAELQDNGNGTITQIRDDDTSLMWIKDAGIGGRLTWDEAKVWAENLVYAGYEDWRLPTADSSCGNSYDCISSEMGNLFYSEDISLFTGISVHPYWSGTAHPIYPAILAYAFTFNGWQDAHFLSDDLYVWAVRDVDQLFDSDNDGIHDVSDNCPNHSNPDQVDIDEDGIGDVCDNCPDVANPGQENSDSDAIGNACDNCPLDSNPDQLDSDGDGVGNLCDVCIGNDNVDDDADGMCNDSDNCPSVLNPQQEDYDGDGVGDSCDNCPGMENSNQANTDVDIFGDVCDNCPDISNDDQANNDGDEQGDVCDPDDDNDGILDADDNCPFVTNSDQADYDYDGIGDACDEDDDGDGVSDPDDLCPGTAVGANVDGNGCSGEQLVDLDCPCDIEPAWKNHGQYISCVAHAAEDQLAAGLITQAEKDAIVSARAKSGCGKKK